MPTNRCWIAFFFGSLFVSNATAQFNSQSDGSDGAFNPQQSVQIDLSQAVTAAWGTPSPQPGKGVYDAAQWAVVFKYTTIDISAGVTVTFRNHPSGAPVVWLAQGNVTIAGTVSLDGAAGAAYTGPSGYAEPGPGGFPGGRRKSSSTLLSGRGFGPGGGFFNSPSGSVGGGGGGGYGTPGGDSGYPLGGKTYGIASILPLIGGSGGGGRATSTMSSGGGGAGGGAILIASSADISLSGFIHANGGSGGLQYGGGGSGGAIRVLCNSILGAGTLRAAGGNGNSGPDGGGNGGKGRIRVECEIDNNMSDVGDPPYTSSTPGPLFSPNTPRLVVQSIDGVAAPPDPIAGVLSTEVSINNDSTAVVTIEAYSIPLIQSDGVTPVTVTVIIVPARDSAGFTRTEVTSTPLAGSQAYSTATANVVFPPGRCEIQLRANWTNP